MSFRRNFNMLGLNIRKHGPEILAVTAIGSGIAAVIFGVIAGTKIKSIQESDEKRINDILENPDNQIETTEEDENGEKNVIISYPDEVKKAVTKERLKTFGEYAKVFGPAVAFEVVSIASIVSGNRIQANRYAALGAAYTALSAMYERYRQNVREELGEDVDRDMRFGVKRINRTKTMVDADGNEVEVVEKVEVVDKNNRPDFSKFFDPSCKAWEDNVEYNRMYLQSIQAYCNNLLVSRGYLFLNEVYKQIGFEPTISGQSVGWIYDKENPTGDNYVDFGLFEVNVDSEYDEHIKYEPVILLDFNIDPEPILTSPKLKKILFTK